MRRIIIIILCCLMLATTANAAGITDAKSQTMVKQDGSCDVTLTVTLQFEQPVEHLKFPLPVDARNITVNGSNARSSQTSTVRNIDLSSHISGAGTYTLVIRYSLPDAVTEDEKSNLILTIPLLSGFAYPVDGMSFTVTLPGVVEGKPSFTSTYYQGGAEAVMDIQISDSVISGTFLVRLQDHESLTMTLPVTEKLFPQSVAKKWSLDTVDLLMMGVALLAIAYWLITMRTALPRKVRRAFAPEGVTAGQVGCILSGRGVDFTLMVLSWAQMGYLLIQPDGNGRILLHKRMDMGNERSEFENRYFRNLFGRRRTVDGTGHHYARMCAKAERTVLGAQIYYRRSTGNPKIFRAVATLVGILAGISMATALVRDTGWQVVLGILFSILFGAASWAIQWVAIYLRDRNKIKVWIGLACAAVWVLGSILADEWNVAMFVIPGQFVAGMAAGYGGLRSDSGKQMTAELLGLRRFLRKVSKEDMQRILRDNPDYFHSMAPYALALGVERAFARQVGNHKLPQCTYLTTGTEDEMTATDWIRLLRETADSLDALKRRMPIDRLLGR